MNSGLPPDNLGINMALHLYKKTEIEFVVSYSLVGNGCFMRLISGQKVLLSLGNYFFRYSADMFSHMINCWEPYEK